MRFFLLHKKTMQASSNKTKQLHIQQQNTPSKLPYGTRDLNLVLLPSGPHTVRRTPVAQDLDFNMIAMHTQKPFYPQMLIQPRI